MNERESKTLSFPLLSGEGLVRVYRKTEISEMSEKPKIALITDLDVNEGIGKYGQYLYEFVKDKFPTDYLYLDYRLKGLIKNPGNERELIAKTNSFPLDNKPFFWKRIKKKIPSYDFYHIVSQNLSFLMTDKPFIITVHDLAPLFSPGSIVQKWGRRYLYSGIKKARKILSDSHSTKDDLMKIFKIAEDKIRVVHLGVNLDLFKPQDKKFCRIKVGLPLDRKIILNVAIEKWRKNVPNLVKAFALVNQKIPESILVRIGYKTPEVADLISRLKISDKVLYFSNLPTEENLALFYNAADLFVFPSYYEGFGLPPLEAMACGTPALVANRTSLPEIVQDQKMWVDPDNPQEIADKTVLLLSNPNLYQGAKQKALQQAQKFFWDKTVNETFEVYKEFL